MKAKNEETNPLDASTVTKQFLFEHLRSDDKTTIDAVVGRYGPAVFSRVRDDPDALNFLKLSEEERNSFRNRLGLYSCFEMIVHRLEAATVDISTASRLYDRYAVEAESILTNEPYRTYYDGVLGLCDADKLHLKGGAPANHAERRRAYVLAAIDIDSKETGSTYTEKDSLKGKLMGIISGASSNHGDTDFLFEDKDIDSALNELAADDRVVLTNYDGKELVFLKRHYNDERAVAEGIANLIKTRKKYKPKLVDFFESEVTFQKETGKTLSPKQKAALLYSLCSPITTITGGPGTGKTLVIRAIAHTVNALTPSANIILCAPTGAAADHLASITGISCSTIHSLLRISPEYEMAAVKDLPCDYIVIDEASLLDVHIAALLFKAVPATARIILVGDPNQLCSVSPGNVLKDIVDSNCATNIALSETSRQGSNSTIVSNANAILSATPDQKTKLYFADDPLGEFCFCESTNTSTILSDLTDVVDVYQTSGIERSQIQILSPTKNGALGTEELNRYLQDRLNRPLGKKSSELFYVGDRVMQTVNNKKKSICNGEIGYVSSFIGKKRKYLTVEFPGKGQVTYSKKDVENEITLAYAVTVHKSQGNEFDAVVLVLSPYCGRALTKRMLYTAITRAKKHVFIIGSSDALTRAIFTDNSNERRTSLSYQLREFLKGTPFFLSYYVSIRTLYNPRKMLYP